MPEYYLCFEKIDGIMIEESLSLGKQIRIERQRMKFSQAELADKCHLNVRTIQRIENDEISPRLYTLRIIGEVLGVGLTSNNESEKEEKHLILLRKKFERRKQIRLVTFLSGLLILAVTFFLLLAGTSKRLLVPFFYLFFFIDLIVIGLTWRCPGCNGLLGEVFNVRFCSKCGLRFYNDIDDKG